MPTYDYSCTKCGNVKEVFHSISELEIPSEETLEEITCCDRVMVQAFITAPAVKTPTASHFITKDRKKRNKDHFKKEVLPSIIDKDAKKHHLNKLGIKS